MTGRIITCRNCAYITLHRAHELCGPCAQYLWRTGVDRPAVTTRQCVNCGQRARKGQWRQGLCARCYAALYRCHALGGVA
jgi:hypothetical protein